jgi:hypothetical protein
MAVAQAPWTMRLVALLAMFSVATSTQLMTPTRGHRNVHQLNASRAPAQAEENHRTQQIAKLFEERETLVEPSKIGAEGLHLASGAAGALHKNTPIFDAPFAITSETSCEDVWGEDLNNDGLVDVFAACGGQLAWYRNLGSGAFADATVLDMDDTGSVSYVSTFDMDNDGLTDVVKSMYSGKVSWFKNLGGGTSFAAESVIADSAQNSFVRSFIVSDLDNDGLKDVLYADFTDRKVVWHKNMGGGSFGTQSVIASGVPYMYRAHASDLDGDGHTDVIWSGLNALEILWCRNTGSGSFEAPSVITDETSAHFMNTADLDNDGNTDVLYAQYSRQPAEIGWVRNLGGGSFSTKSIIDPDCAGANMVRAVDMDMDGNLDVVATCYGNGFGPRWYRNLGGGNFASASIIWSGPHAWSIFPADLDNDGDIDILTGTSLNGARVSINSAATPPTPSPTLIATPTPPASGSATGDPHLQNVHGERFDLMKPGTHVLVNIPREESVDNALLRVEARASKLGGQCEDIYFTELNVTGSWAQARQRGGYHFLAQQDIDGTGRWLAVGKVELKIVHGHTEFGTQYLNFYVKHLGRTGLAVGGLLGEEDHSDVSTPPAGCVHHMNLYKLSRREHGSGSRASTVAIATSE